MRGRTSKNDMNNIINNVVQLKKEFKRTSGEKTFNHRLVYHKDGWYIYIVDESFYEVFKEKIINKVDYDANNKMTVNKELLKVKYPNDEDFGRWAWTYNSYDECIKKINIIEKAVKRPSKKLEYR